jgi:transposase-like protein
MTTAHTFDLDLIRSEIAARIGRGRLEDTEALEEGCRAYLSRLRWPAGVECPRCGEAARLLWLASRSKWNCYECRYQFSVTAGTVFHGSHLPVWKWFVAVQMMLSSPHGLTAYELRRTLGGSYKTAWFAAHRIRAAMHGQSQTPRPGLVWADLPRGSVAPKYLRAYLDERRWRVAHRGNPLAFRDTIRALLHAEGISYDRLVAAA